MARKRYSAEERAALLEQLSNWEESLAGFARGHGVSVATLYHWQRQAGTSEPVRADHYPEIRYMAPSETGAQLVSSTWRAADPPSCSSSAKATCSINPPKRP